MVDDLGNSNDGQKSLSDLIAGSFESSEKSYCISRVYSNAMGETLMRVSYGDQEEVVNFSDYLQHLDKVVNRLKGRKFYDIFLRENYEFLTVEKGSNGQTLARVNFGDGRETVENLSELLPNVVVE